MAALRKLSDATSDTETCRECFRPEEQWGDRGGINGWITLSDRKTTSDGDFATFDVAGVVDNSRSRVEASRTQSYQGKIATEVSTMPGRMVWQQGHTVEASEHVDVLVADNPFQTDTVMEIRRIAYPCF